MATIDLYLIRHGLAAERGTYTNDGDRPLTEAGYKKTRQVAKRLLDLNLRFDQILTSPLVRARQTADILVDIGLGKTLQEVGYLAPGGNIHAWVDWFHTWKDTNPSCIALVGHEPDLSEWAEILLWGKASGVLVLKKAGVIGLTLPLDGSPIASSQLFWLTPPRLL